MELSPRKQEILAAIIKTYLETGEPVGSKVLCGILGNRLSSATLRNEMSELCELGYLEQPHTSAGRTPTRDGYRFYLSRLMPVTVPSAGTKKQLDQLLAALPREPEQVLPAAAAALSGFTGLPALIATLPNQTATFSLIRLAPMGNCRLLLVAMTSNGISKSRLCRTIWEPAPAQLNRLQSLLSVALRDVPLGAVTPALLQGLLRQAQEDALLFMPVLDALSHLVESLAEPQLLVHGAAKLHGFPLQEPLPWRVVELLEQKQPLLRLLSRIDAPVSVSFGSDSELEALQSLGLVVAGFNFSGAPVGRVGVLGPIRMNYPYLIPCMEYFAAGVGKALTTAYEMEV